MKTCGGGVTQLERRVSNALHNMNMNNQNVQNLPAERACDSEDWLVECVTESLSSVS